MTRYQLKILSAPKIEFIVATSKSLIYTPKKNRKLYLKV